MMRRMLKRKIHPDLEGKGNKLEGQCKASVIDAVASNTLQANESVFLLQSPGIYVKSFIFLHSDLLDHAITFHVK